MGTRVEVWISDELAVELDEARGATPRGRWIGELIAREVHGPTYGADPLPSRLELAPGAEVPPFPAPPDVMVVAGGWCVHPPVFVDDPVEQTIPLTPEAKARSAKLWAEVGERLAAERADPGPDPV